jgi:hypothetical protein
MNAQQFTATLETHGTRVLVPLPFDPNAAWGAKERHHIHGTINGITIRGALIIAGKQFYLSLGPAWLKGSGLAAGAVVQVALLPEGPQGDNLPEDVHAALEREPQAKAFFESLPTFYRKNFLRPIENAKRPETRAKNLAAMLELLRAGKREK